MYLWDMGIDVDRWSDQEKEDVERTISLMASSFNLGPEDVKSAIRRETKIRNYNNSGKQEGRPSKKEKFIDRFVKIVENKEAPKETRMMELEQLFMEMEQDVSRGTRYNIRRGINREYNIYIKKRFKNMQDRDLENLSELVKV